MKMRDRAPNRTTKNMPKLSEKADELLHQFDAGAQLYGMECGENNACDGTKDAYHNSKRKLAAYIAELESKR